LLFDNRIGENMTLEQIERSLDRLRSRLYRTVNAINKLEKAHRRIKRRMESQDAETQTAQSQKQLAQSEKSKALAESVGPAVAVPNLGDLDIPAALKRPPVNPADARAKEEILAQQEAAKKIKTTARIAKLKADKAGDTKRMPLTGKAALAAINQA
jgi:hypothetical protein